MKLRNKVILAVLTVVGAVCFVGLTTADKYAGKVWKWPVHDKTRPMPKLVKASSDICGAPSDAVVLFSGKDMSSWENVKGGGEPGWSVEDGCMVPKASGDIRTKQAFGDCQLHVEYMCPVVKAEEQDAKHPQMGNSGVYLMSKYEVQILNSRDIKLYADGMAGAIYGQYAPLVDASKNAGQWQRFDIIFRSPVFDKAGALVKAARVTVLHNNILVQDNSEIYGATVWKKRAKYEAHAEKLPLLLQYHGDKVSFRNIWIRELGAEDKPWK